MKPRAALDLNATEKQLQEAAGRVVTRCPLCPPVTAWVLEEWAEIARMLGCTLCDVALVALDLRAVNHEAHAQEVAA